MYATATTADTGATTTKTGNNKEIRQEKEKDHQ